MPDQNTPQPQDGTAASNSPADQTNAPSLSKHASGDTSAGGASSLDFTYPQVGNGLAPQPPGGSPSDAGSPSTPAQPTDASGGTPPPQTTPPQVPPGGAVDIQSPGSVSPVPDITADTSDDDAGTADTTTLPPEEPSLPEESTESLSNLAQKLSTWKEDGQDQPMGKAMSPQDQSQGQLQEQVQGQAKDQEQLQDQVQSQAQDQEQEMPQPPAPEPPQPETPVSVPQNPLSPDVKSEPSSSYQSDQGGGMFGPPAPLHTDKGEAGVEEMPDLRPAADEPAEDGADTEDPVEDLAPEPSAPSPVQEVVTIQGSNSRGGYPYTIEDLMQIVVEKEASDLHITVNYPAMIRVGGVLLPVGQELVTEEIVKDLVLPTLPESKQELLDVNREVDLAYTFREDARFRINAFYTKGHISGAYRLIPNRIRTIEELKLPGAYHSLTRLPQGLVLVTGPTGHGKSTTLAALIQEINATYPKHIITIEDPIEYVYPRARGLVDQRGMHEDTHSWEIALRSAMREDPDVVLVGEMRDFETIQSAITLAETGHLVFATLHTNSAAQAIDRVVDVFPEHQQEQVQTQLSMILEAIISQRLIPVKSGGRRAVSEVLLATGAVRNLVREGKSHQLDNVIRTSLDVGMKTLEHSLVDLIREGELTMEEAEGVAINPEEISRLMKM
jgi:twitching motility protein PilT